MKKAITITSNGLLSACRLRPQVIMTDFDGTFMGDNITLLQSTIKAYQNAIKSGYKIFFATGRDCESLQKILEHNNLSEEIPTFPGVYYNGAVVYGPKGYDDIIYEAKVDVDGAMELYNLINDINNKIIVDENWEEKYETNKTFSKGFDFYSVRDKSLSKVFIDVGFYFEGTVYFNSVNQLTDGFMQYQKSFVKFGDVVELSKTKKIHKCIILSHNENSIQFIKPQIEKMIQGRYSCVSAIDKFLEIVPYGINKANGIKKLAEYMNFPLNVATIGDGDNDVEMLETFPISIAMENGSIMAKNAAKFRTHSLDEDGWAFAINTIVDTYPIYFHPQTTSKTSTKVSIEDTDYENIPYEKLDICDTPDTQISLV